ncbi:hypothetical protein [Desulforhopalus singaporensis]|uniref:Uncharacterized protein n=1 Tax=Desulforhopalus singaporensis TaxID=91360 RepID=A0A1H0VDE4_9BACT|nr:hypothetical protein [Desulforhopalus singaporensis]SDP76364.1 hypothetical protein SAMN05660330_03999 [Desulforhopalus singaporensis]
MAESVTIKYGHFHVESKRMEKILTQEINEHETERIVRNRLEFLDWMNRHFAYKTVLAPDKYK